MDVCTDVLRTDDFLQTKISLKHRLAHFLTHGAPLHALRARESINCININCFFFQGMQKINFSGGEPFIHKRGDFVGELVRYCKTELGIQSVTIVCNGSLVTERWFKSYGKQAVVFV